MEFLIKSRLLVMFLLLNSCVHSKDYKPAANARVTRPRHVEKPASASQDTVRVSVPAAVFFSPDSAQLEKVKDILDTAVYGAIMHDYYYQMRYSRRTIAETWPSLVSIDASNCRYLVFTERGNSRKVIDLDQTKDLYGVYLFDAKKDPALADMPNINTALNLYFGKN